MSKDLPIAAWPRLLAALALCLLAGAGAAPQAFARAAPRQRALEAILGTSRVSTIVSRRVCARPSRGQAACAARVLIDSATGKPAHPPVPGPPAPAADVAPALSGSTPPAAGTPAYLQQAYDLSWLSANAGSGQTIGVVDAYGDPTAESDLATFRSKYGLPPCTEGNGCFSKRDQSGGTNLPKEEQGWDLETSLDLDAVSAICPNCHIVLVEAESASISNLAAAEARADALGATQISDSWGVEESSPPPETEMNMSQFSFPGVATVAAAGDAAYTGLIEWPAAYPAVTAAGGTTLLSSGASPRGWSEKVWYEPATELEEAAGTGSGCNGYEAKPAYQQDSGCAGRSYNDLSATGDPSTGLRVYDTSGYGGWVGVGGTSLATPMIAAYYALIGGGVGDQSPSWAYTNAASLNDVVSGSNGSCPSAYSYICSARIGYDGPTGVGSISGDAIAGGPGVGGPGGSYVRSTAPTSAKLEGGIYPNQQEATYWWEYGTTSAYGQQSEPLSVGGGAHVEGTSSELTGLTPSTTYHFRLCAQNPSGTVCGYDYTLTTQPAPRPAISSTRAVNVGSAGAELTGVINPNGVATEFAFEYGTTNAYGQTTPFADAGAGTSPEAVSHVIEGLAPATTYHFRLLVRYGSGTTERSADDHFTTPAAAPTVESLSASNIGETEATLHATIDAKGEAATYRFSYGSSAGAAQSTSPASAGLGRELPASATLTGLQPGTTYQYEVIASNGQGPTHSLQLSFTTTAALIPPSPGGGLTGSSTAASNKPAGTVATGTAAASQLVLRGVNVARRVVTARLLCSGTAACRARVLIEARITTGSHGSPRTSVPAIIARVDLRLGGGRSSARRIAFNSAGRALLRRHRHLHVTLLAQQQQAGGAFVTVTRRSITT